MAQKDRHLVLLGIRGLPAKHGGFETFAEYLSLYLVSRGWHVTVYCQEEGAGKSYRSEWKGILRVHIPINTNGPLSTVVFDFKSVLDARRLEGVFLTLGYNTAIFALILRIYRKKNLFNMDGIEWKRSKWGYFAKLWFRLNERLACAVGNHLIADHPAIASHLASMASPEKITTIPYGGEKITAANEEKLANYGIKRNQYALIVARAEPENSILEIVTAFSSRLRGIKLVVLGSYEPTLRPYHRSVLAAASEEVVFAGAIYDVGAISSLRFFARFYIHGHQVGGTNPSLVEALGAGSAVLAHGNEFNRFVAIDRAIEKLIRDDSLLESLRLASSEHFQKHYQWKNVLISYERLLLSFL
jgi:glycosyltransferase involved in cell wall biosynthesis